MDIHLGQFEVHLQFREAFVYRVLWQTITLARKGQGHSVGFMRHTTFLCVSFVIVCVPKPLVREWIAAIKYNAVFTF